MIKSVGPVPEILARTYVVRRTSHARRRSLVWKLLVHRERERERERGGGEEREREREREGERERDIKREGERER